MHPNMRIFLIGLSSRIGFPTLIAYLFSVSTPLENDLYLAAFAFVPLGNIHASTCWIIMSQ